ncbi:helix-turn-helix domain-containing protein [Burkholderia pseudomallei]|uniref:helix-turn-helix domain-containing protein n=1 Tax=Burkholderia pseudomallei TaxID=28450 RepID=UPI00071826F2|nr:helix-turn-helix transcriptional regulator [Burkholderia pseudomallei]MBF3450554.1 helix-turn-helix transcriptional regulator [Burkholderia pseudomallei]MBF3813249.1 helix-turn-helix transcriptional regulator [Burkholderia pseudomallei]MBF3843492.1 helix-turn-helix transcriptional regulator [Burkholderia pseudomallei]OMS49968.1 transcriptional regulator [Burkholderia pseudomallei]OMS59930.1 transcriptional regulator [Burkholderia pseudomallei]
MEKSIYSRRYAQFAKLLRAAREEAGFTQEEVAARLKTTQTFISKCERGERRLDVIELCSWCEALGIPASQFVVKLEQKF